MTGSRWARSSLAPPVLILRHQPLECLGHLIGVRIMCRRGGKHNRARSRSGHPAPSRRLSHDTLAPVAKDGISKPLSCDEGDLSRTAFVVTQNSYAQELAAMPSPAREYLFELRPGLDGLHLPVRDGQPLATLGATTGEDGTAALGGHTGTEAVALGPLALVRLVSTLHFEFLLGTTLVRILRKPQDCRGLPAILSISPQRQRQSHQGAWMRIFHSLP